MTKHFTTAEILAKALGGTTSGTGWMAKCPCHDDSTASLSIGDGKNGAVVVHCHAGCTQDDVIGALKARDLWPSGDSGQMRRQVAAYAYTDEAGTALFEVVRFEPKTFRQRRRDDQGRTIWNMQGVRQVPYRLPELLEAIADERLLFVVEGEKDVDNLAELGIPATTNAMGAGKWRDELAEHFRGADVVVLPDNDEPGRAHARDVATKLNGIAKRVRILELPDLPLKGDVSDEGVRKNV